MTHDVVHRRIVGVVAGGHGLAQVLLNGCRARFDDIDIEYGFNGLIAVVYGIVENLAVDCFRCDGEPCVVHIGVLLVENREGAAAAVGLCNAGCFPVDDRFDDSFRFGRIVRCGFCFNERCCRGAAARGNGRNEKQKCDHRSR